MISSPQNQRKIEKGRWRQVTINTSINTSFIFFILFDTFCFYFILFGPPSQEGWSYIDFYFLFFSNFLYMDEMVHLGVLLSHVNKCD